jgi:ubiquinone/menaquinone biosynthesis C-methylase UbiE
VAVKIPERVVWAVDVLDVQPDDHILEIGCGHGLAVTLICERLHNGQLTALDRSQKMIEVTKQRNASAFRRAGCA